jgi:hypothetical protein
MRAGENLHASRTTGIAAVTPTPDALVSYYFLLFSICSCVTVSCPCQAMQPAAKAFAADEFEQPKIEDRDEKGG